ncbi:sensor histidine kinase [Leptotrichia buccalis]|uniref:Sensor with HAMP domain n=1 Tax=Leptotrichia buccalis (strain ATCC 14201 / DSM 1135 / JCM 12969 / NCTC 10249 / C-1013-b) TaxID=523794 RepID=C7NE40_LEPBD|nr:sensor histidine kinase [Leptotrichia buccalis]ACV38235.1 putative sensor with HAMP domain [Leptotrichia buccalis C-1013-b]
MKFKKTMKNSMLLQLFFYYLIGNLLFILFLSSIFYYTSKYLIMNKEIEYTNKNVISTSRYITLYADKLKNMINLLSVDADVRNFLISGNEDSKKSIEKMIYSILDSNKGIKNITVIGKNGNIVSSDKNNDMKISENMMKEKWYVDAINNSDMPVFNPSRKNSTSSMNSALWFLSISRDIKNSKGENLGVIVFDIKYEILERYLNSISFGKQIDNIIVDKNNNIIYYKDVKCFADKKCLAKFSEKNKNKDTYLYETQIENTNWNLRSLANTNDLVTLKKNFSHIVIIIFLVSLAFSSIITFIVITKILRPLIKLENHMQNFENNLREFHLSEKTGYEIQNLVEHFNIMVEKIKYLREYEIKALHSQINPHFLYNTLDTIIWMAEFKDNEKVINITKSLANFFRLSLSNGHEKIPLKDEIMHTKEYLFIQKQRYEDKLSYFFNIEDESLLSIEVPKIIIQPIVENSIYHGIKNLSENGIITIDVYRENSAINILIKDNGIGFEKAKQFKKSKTGGVGIKNVDKRIKFYYGKNYGVFINKDNKTEGAEVIIKIPFKSI